MPCTCPPGAELSQVPLLGLPDAWVHICVHVADLDMRASLHRPQLERRNLYRDSWTRSSDGGGGGGRGPSHPLLAYDRMWQPQPTVSDQLRGFVGNALLTTGVGRLPASGDVPQRGRSRHRLSGGGRGGPSHDASFPAAAPAAVREAAPLSSAAYEAHQPAREPLPLVGSLTQPLAVLRLSIISLQLSVPATSGAKVLLRCGPHWLSCSLSDMQPPEATTPAYETPPFTEELQPAALEVLLPVHTPSVSFGLVVYCEPRVGKRPSILGRWAGVVGHVAA